MNPFKFSKAANERAAMRMVQGDASADFIAGGTNKIDLIRQYVETNSQLVDINMLPLRDIKTVKVTGGNFLRIGALARMSDVAEAPLVKQNFPVISEALLLSASPQLRNMASIGGNLMQRTRCPYFRQTAFPQCNKRQPGSGCASIKGENRTNAVLGTSDHCIATHASDLAVALVALDAVVELHSSRGVRRVPLVDFHLLPSATPHLETVLQHGELITAVDVPMLPFASNSHYLKVRDRASYEFAICSAAVALDMNGENVRTARVAFGGIATKPWRSREAEAALQGKPANESMFREAARVALQGATPQSQNAFKIELAQRTLVRALTDVAAKNGGRI